MDIQIHDRNVRMKRILERTVPADLARQILDAPDSGKAFYTQWVLREAYVKWTGEGLSRDLRKIDLDEGWYELLSMNTRSSVAVYAASPMEMEWKKAEITLQK